MTLGPQFDEMNDDQLHKAAASALRRLNNLESRYGGVIPKRDETMLRPSDRWWTKKEALLNEAAAIREEKWRREGGREGDPEQKGLAK